jgi:prevent-host-death family protein
MKTITALELRAKVGQYLDEASAGERIVVERAGQPLCAIVPLKDIEDLDPDRIRDRRLAALESIRSFARQHPAPVDWDTAAFISRARQERGEHIVRAVEESHARRKRP